MVKTVKYREPKRHISKVVSNKSQLRQEYLTVRNNLTTVKKIVKSRTISKELFNITEIKNSQIIAVYLPLEKEVDIKLFIKKALKNKQTILLPRIEGKKMIFHEIKSLKFEFELWKGLKMPLKNTAKYELKDIDIILVPGIVFDNHGCRIGFGAGYYDRYLKNNKKTHTTTPTFT